MTELTPLARKLQIAYLNRAITDSDDTEAWAKVEVRWNAAAKTAEDELVTPHPVRLPTVEECHRAIGASCANALVDPASVVLDLVASLNPTWVPVPADATIPAGTRVRVEEPGTVRATEFEWRPKDQVFAEDRATENFAYFVPSGTVLTWGRYRKKPVVVEAMQLVGTNAETHAVYQWIEANTQGSFDPLSEEIPASGVSIDPATGDFLIATLEGVMQAKPGDWIIRGVQGEFYPIKSDIFEATYERVDDDERTDSVSEVRGDEAS